MERPEPTLPLADVKAMIRGAGLRSTTARVAVIQQLASVRLPQTHADVTAALEAFGFDQSTIYRCLTELTDAGLVARLDLGDSLRRFELLKSGTDGFSQHPHFMCVSCGSVSCMDDHSFKIKANNRNATAPGEIQEVLLKGRCSSCQ
ncbi:MAG TPA: Fur family transcriptional regulator [Planctomycetaceae bacterium]|jgi:Fur family ferric uptake transcriptional regulator|nr:Fur family transcriptional regulator [Planctomycetaceae bacterium]HCK51719.1 Fur family transcriptional regulator [Planctomycetaceae bacterium]|tara:strand:+ start:247 stop:687 length:441 start_codon:yes stop_codon:yes gene_type:complete